MFKSRNKSLKSPKPLRSITTKRAKTSKTIKTRSTRKLSTTATTTLTPQNSTTNPLLVATPLNRTFPPITKQNKIQINVLKLPRCSPLAMLHLEERLLRHDPLKRNFVILNRPLPHHNSVILGISGKPDQLVNCELASRDNIPLIKRFTGGGTVYITSDIRFIGLVINKEDVPHVQPYPTPVMKWTAEIYEDCINNLRQSSKPEFQRYNKLRQEDQLFFSLYENDYCLGSLRAIEDMSSTQDPNQENIVVPQSQPPTTETDGNSQETNGNSQETNTTETPSGTTALKFAGNAQSFIRERFLHHTSILWDLDIDNISKYLTLPSKRPAYRQNRSHRDFLTDLRPLFDIKSKEQNIDYFDDFKQEDGNKHLAGCEYTDAFTHQKDQMLEVQSQLSTLATAFFSSENKFSDEQHQNSAMAEYKQKKATLQAQIDQLTFPNLYTHLKSHQDHYISHASMLSSMGGVIGADQCQFNDNLVGALANHFEVKHVTLDELRDVIDLGDGNLGSYIIPPH